VSIILSKDYMILLLDLLKGAELADWDDGTLRRRLGLESFDMGTTPVLPRIEQKWLYSLQEPEAKWGKLSWARKKAEHPYQKSASSMCVSHRGGPPRG